MPGTIRRWIADAFGTLAIFGLLYLGLLLTQ
jgi:hypothetical protein